MMRYLPVLAFLLLFSVLAVGLWRQISLPPTQVGGIENQALPVLKLNYVMGEKLPEAAPFMGRVTVLNIFASWCVPCIAELPQLAVLYATPKVQVVGIAWHDKPDVIKRWVAQHGALFHSIYQDADNQTGVKLGIRGVPETYIVDAKGIVRYHHLGPIDAYNRKEEIEPLLAKLVAENNEGK